MARPSSFTSEIGELICRRLADGESLRKICRDEDMPDKETVRKWKADFPEFLAQYARAREEQADSLVEEAVETAILAKDAALGRLAYDALRWHASKLMPKVYGDKVQHTGGDGEGPVVTEVVYRWAEPPKTE